MYIVAMADRSAAADDPLGNQPEQDPEADPSAAAGEAAGSEPHQHPNGPVELDETTEVRVRGAIAELENEPAAMHRS